MQQPYTYMTPEGLTPAAPVPEAGWFARHKRILMLVGAGVILAVVVLLVVIFFVQRARANRLAAEREQQAMEQALAIETSQCNEARNREGCLAAIRPNLAEQSGDIKYCAGLDSAAYDNCVALAAFAARNGEYCQAINNDAKRQSCQDTVVALTPNEERTFATCAEFNDAKLRQECELDLTLRKIIAGDCDEPQITPDLCQIGQAIKQAQDLQDPDYCQPIADENYRSTCLFLTSPGDRDFDGLNASREEHFKSDDRNPDSDGDGLNDGDEVDIWRTDPADADTDGDSFSDGTEVQSGYNPLGAGRL